MPSNKSIKRSLALIENDESKILGLSVGTHRNVQPGQYIPKADAQSAPELSFKLPDPTSTYIIVNLDLDGPFPSLNALSPIMHWIQPGLKPTATDTDNYTLEVTAPFVVNYIGPGPPPGSSPHRYVFFLYEQPAGFDGSRYAPPHGKDMGIWPRLRYDLDKWEEETKLGPVVAVNYFTSN
ncbi:YbhB/YbcL family Raf kinase inhibitor-like protein [Aspergillus homomorphus CBS 101889]|uniref:Putative protease inhibitor n=1 Tax=Aspergillus homomorphus (strain CBS 101889) TaxID=1450537 RepID=A0A395HME2_ASPHC|nr:putative protease inhibitor [Aspergillus homomorphus CBS 101889]RAL08028.1 putative protease inhibitor [Aspergillus homomorphus CBS 101889]